MSAGKNNFKKSLLVMFFIVLIIAIAFMIGFFVLNNPTSNGAPVVNLASQSNNYVNNAMPININNNSENKINLDNIQVVPEEGENTEFIDSYTNDENTDIPIEYNNLEENTNNDNLENLNENVEDAVNSNMEQNNSSIEIDNNQDIDIIVKDKSKVTVDIKSGSLTTSSATLVVTDLNKPSYAWGTKYKLQVKQENMWQDMQVLNETAWEEISYVLNENNQFEQNIDWSSLYGEVGSGDYRIVKFAEYHGEAVEFYVEFRVNVN